MAPEDFGQGPAVETPAAEASPSEVPQQAVETPGNSQQTESDGHPAWAPIREALGEVLFHKIKPTLSEFDKSANERITKTNSQYEPWKKFVDQGVTPDVVGRALGIVQGIDANPLQMYEALKNHLTSQGMLPAQAEAALDKAGIEDPNAEPVDPRDEALQALQEQQEQMRLFLEDQQRMAMEQEYGRQADSALDAEISALRQARPDLSPQEIGGYLKRLSLYMQAGQYDMTLEKVASEFDAERNRILSQPRPNDFAPRIPGAGGAAPTGVPQQKKPEEFTREESQAYFADLLMRNQGS